MIIIKVFFKLKRSSTCMHTYYMMNTRNKRILTKVQRFLIAQGHRSALQVSRFASELNTTNIHRLRGTTQPGARIEYYSVE